MFKVLRVVAVLLAVPGLPAVAADPPKCKLVRVAEWPVRLVRGQPITEGAINGKKVGVLLDTGASASSVTKDAAEKLGLDTRSTSQWVTGFGGDSRMYVTRIDELRLGDAVRKNLRVRVIGERPMPGVDFILGDDVFSALDTEFDYARGVVRWFNPLDCKGVSLAYWDRDALQLPMEDEPRIMMTVMINGREARAMLDSGASISVVSRYFAKKVGITPETPGVVPGGCSTGIGADYVRQWVARFDTVALGAEIIRDPRIVIADFHIVPDRDSAGPIDMILGTDFLRSHRVLVARSQRKVYFAYSGGLVFPSTPALDCDDSLFGKGAAEARAALDQAIAKNPRDTKALLNRGSLRLSQKDAQGALADFDSAVRTEPENAVALTSRADARAALGDHEGALADSESAIANGMRTARMYVIRGILRRTQGDTGRAIDEFGEALKLDPHHQGALRSQGFLLFEAGRFEAAEGNFAALLAIRPNGIDAIWASMARTRRGLEGSAILEKEIARMKDGGWPAPVMLHLLGRIDRDALFAAAVVDEKKRKGQLCEARFYVAEHLIAAGKRDEARPLLEAARNECPQDFVEYGAALAELAN
jgi:clan AA aspartic protease (TIGR02281 family)